MHTAFPTPGTPRLALAWLARAPQRSSCALGTAELPQRVMRAIVRGVSEALGAHCTISTHARADARAVLAAVTSRSPGHRHMETAHGAQRARPCTRNTAPCLVPTHSDKPPHRYQTCDLDTLEQHRMVYFHSAAIPKSLIAAASSPHRQSRGLWWHETRERHEGRLRRVR